MSNIKKLILLGCVSAMVTGCVPAVFVAGGAAGAAIGGDNRSVQRISDDTDMAYRANNLIQANQTLAEQTHINVTVFDGIALMTGQAPNEKLKQEAEALVKSVKNIKKVYNQVRIGENTGAFARSQDGLITTNVKTRMLTTTDLKSNQFKIVTEDGVVYIMGLTTRQQADIAADVASHSSGVKQVVKLIVYKD